MEKNKKIVFKFSVDEIAMESTEDSRFQKVTIKAFASGPNAHTLPVSEDVLKRTSETIYKVPIVSAYIDDIDDFAGHEIEEVPIGYIPPSTDSEPNPIRFNREDDGRVFLVVSGLIWKHYSGESFRVIDRDKKKAVSVELTCSGTEDDQGRIDMTDIVYQAVTVLGNFVRPAVKDASLEVKMSNEIDDYIKDKKETDIKLESKVKIDNSKEAAITTGRWQNPRGRLFNKIVNSSNSKSLLKEAYIIGPFDDENPVMSDFKYPHHEVNDDNLVVNQKGLQSAFSRLKQQDEFSGEYKSHIKRHYDELGLSEENFSIFGFTKEEYIIYFSDFKKESVGDTMDKEKNIQDQKMEAVPQSETNNGDVPKAEVNGTDIPQAETGNTDSKAQTDANNLEEKEKRLYEMEEKVKELEAIVEDLNVKNNAYMEEIEKMSNYSELVKYKEDMEDKIRKEKAFSEMNEILESIGTKVLMSEEFKNELTAKFEELGQDVNIWGNWAKAYAFDNGTILEQSKNNNDNDPDLTKMGLPYDKKADKESISVFDQI